MRRDARSHWAAAALVLLATLSADRSGRAESPRPPQELVEIRTLDRIIRNGGSPIEGIIETADPSPGKPLRVRIRTFTTEFPAGDVKEIIRRRTPEEAYENWVRWLRQEVRAGDSGSVATERQHAEAELALALWCAVPHPALGGSRPMDARALEHLVRAARADPTYERVWPHLVAAFLKRHPVEEAPLEALDQELELYSIARAAGYGAPEMHFRAGEILSRRLGLAEDGARHLEIALEKVRDDGARNQGLVRRARSLLASLHARKGDLETALAIYEDLLAPGAPEEERFIALYESAGLLARTSRAESRALARERLLAAEGLQPEFVEIHAQLAALDYAEGRFADAIGRVKAYQAKRPGDRDAMVDLAIIDAIEGRFEKAEAVLIQALTAEPGLAARSRIGLGMLHELKGDTARALGEYRQVLEGVPGDVLARLLIAAALLRQEQYQEARQVLSALLEEHIESRAVFGACSRLLGLVEAFEGQYTRARGHLEFAADGAPGDASVLEAAGLAFLHDGKLAQGAAYLRRAQELEPDRSATLNGLGYCQYQRGHLGEAAELFDRAIDAMKKMPERARLGDDMRAAMAYATSARSVIRDLETLEVWVDSFEDSDGELIDGWETVELYGVDVAPEDSRVVVRGRQESVADGETGLRMQRTYSSRDVERVAVKLRIDSGRAAPRLVLSGPEGSRSALASLVLFRDLDGRVKFRTRSTQGDWIDPDPGEEADADGLVYPGTATWPDGSGFHTLEVRRSERTSRGERSGAFDLYLDGAPVALNVAVPGLSTAYQLGVYVTTDAIGNEYAVTIDEFRVYRVRPGSERRTGRR